MDRSRRQCGSPHCATVSRAGVGGSKPTELPASLRHRPRASEAHSKESSSLSSRRLELPVGALLQLQQRPRDAKLCNSFERDCLRLSSLRASREVQEACLTCAESSKWGHSFGKSSGCKWERRKSVRVLPGSYTGLQKPSLPSAEAARRRIDSALIGVLRKHETSRMKTRLVTLMHALANLA